MTYRDQQRLADIADEPGIPWSQIARMRDNLAHRYFDTNHAIAQATVDNDLPELDRAITRMRSNIDESGSR